MAYDYYIITADGFKKKYPTINIIIRCMILLNILGFLSGRERPTVRALDAVLGGQFSFYYLLPSFASLPDVSSTKIN